MKLSKKTKKSKLKTAITAKSGSSTKKKLTKKDNTKKKEASSQTSNTSTVSGDWEKTALSIAIGKNSSELKNYFALVSKLIQNTSKCELINFYRKDHSINKLSPKNSLQLFAISQKEKVSIGKELLSYPLSSKEDLDFDSKIEQVFKKIQMQEVAFSLYHFKKESKENHKNKKEITAFKENHRIALYYQPLGNESNHLGGVVFAFSDSANLNTNTIKIFQKLSFLFNPILLEIQLLFLKDNNDQLEENKIELNKKTAANQREIKTLRESLEREIQSLEKSLAEKETTSNNKINDKEKKLITLQESFNELDKVSTVLKDSLTKENKISEKVKKELSITKEELTSKTDNLEKKLSEYSTILVENKKLQSTLEEKQTLWQSEIKNKKELINKNNSLEKKLNEQYFLLTENQKLLSTLEEKHTLWQSEIKNKEELISKNNSLEKKLNKQDFLLVENKKLQSTLEEKHTLWQNEIKNKEELNQIKLAEAKKQFELKLEEERSTKKQEFIEKNSNLYQTLKEKEDKINHEHQEKENLLKEFNEYKKVSENKGNEYKNKLEELEKTKKQTDANLAKAKEKEILLNQNIEGIIKLRKKDQADFKEEQNKHEAIRAEEKKEIENWKLEYQRELKQKFLAKRVKIRSEFSQLSKEKASLALAEKEKHRFENEKRSILGKHNMLVKQIDQLEQKIDDKEKEFILEKNRVIRIEKDNELLKKTIENKDREVIEIKKLKSSLEKEITSYHERQLKQEQALYYLNKEIQEEKLKYNIESQKIQTLIRESERKEENIISLENSLEEKLEAKKKWDWERTEIIEREKSKDKNIEPFLIFLKGFSKCPNIEDNLKYIKNKILNKNIERVILYSLDHLETNQKLTIEGGYWHNQKLPNIEMAPLPLKDSIFGQAIATQNTEIFKGKEGLLDMDISTNSKTMIVNKITRDLDKNDSENDSEKNKLEKLKELEKMEKTTLAFILIIPLVTNEKVIGILTLATKKLEAFDHTIIDTLEKLSPLIALNLEKQLNLKILIEKKNHNESLQKVNQYLQKSYIDIGQYTQNLLEKIKIDISSDTKDDIQMTMEKKNYLRLFLLQLWKENETLEFNHLSFIKWITSLANLAEEKAKITFLQEINLDDLSELISHIGNTFSNLYWLIGEAINNVISHSHANKLHIYLERKNNKFILGIVDDGDGIIRTSGTKTNQWGQGLQIIHDLAKTMGANLKLNDNTETQGLALRVIWDEKNYTSLN